MQASKASSQVRALVSAPLPRFASQCSLALEIKIHESIYNPAKLPLGLPVRSINEKSKKTSGGSTSDGDGEDPSEEDPSESAVVDGLGSGRDETDTGSGTGDAHGGGDGDTVLRGEEDGDGGSELHGETTGWGHESELVSELGHDVVTVGGETDDDHSTTESKNPGGGGRVLGGDGAVGPDVVDGSEGTDGVGNIVGAVGERVGACSENLEERVEVLSLVAVLGGLLVHVAETGGVRAFGLHGVDVLGDTVGENAEELVADNDPEVLGKDPWALDLVLVALEVGEGSGGAGARRLGVGVLKVELLALEGSGGGVLNVVAGGLAGGGGGTVTDDTVVGDVGCLLEALSGVGRSLAAPEERAKEEVVPLDGVVLANDLAVDVWEEEDDGEDGDNKSSKDDSKGNGGVGELVELERGSTLVDDGQGEDGGDGEEVEWRGDKTPLDRVLADENDVLGDEVDDRTKATSKSRSNTETGKDGRETLAAVPAPFDGTTATHGDTDTGKSGNNRVGGGDGPLVASGDHEPGSGSDKSTGEGEHLDTRVATEDRHGDDTVLDGASNLCTDQHCTQELTQCSSNTCLCHCEGARRHGRSKRAALLAHSSFQLLVPPRTTPRHTHFATSLAPMLYASRAAKSKPMAKM